KRWSDAIVTSQTDAAARAAVQPAGTAFLELFQYLAQVIEERRGAPRDDLISVLLRAEGGDALKPAEVVMFTLLLLVAGNETTTNLLGNAVLAMCANPAQLAAVQGDPALVPLLVEEALRYDAPAQVILREVTRDTELAGKKLEAGAI